MHQTTATNLVTLQSLCNFLLGEAQMLAGHIEGARVHAERALVLAREHQERGHQAYALQLLGDIAARRELPDAEQAEIHYQHALALAESLGMYPLTAHCHRSLGELYVGLGRPDKAHAELRDAIEVYHAMDMTFWLPQTEAALAQVMS
jgi:tetratricopeptide (TPR) repeat protein